jgi:GAF domain-containing protein
MAESIIFDQTANKEQKYKQLIPQIQALVGDEPDFIANLANVAAVLKEAFGFFWIGFYLVREDELVLGPFQGPVACTRISKGKGVCGTAWVQRKTLLVPDVNQFPGHIACSAHSKSEIVVPIVVQESVVAVLDVDSELLNHFDAVDRQNLEIIAELLALTIN